MTTVRTTAAVVGILALALNLRAALAGYPPLLGAVRADLGLGAGAAGAIQTAAILAMAAGSLAGAWFGARVTPAGTLGGAVALVGVGSVVRGIPAVQMLVTGTVLVGLGIGVAGVMLTSVVKQRLGHVAGAVTGAYVVAMTVGAGLAGAVAVPTASLLGGWSWSLAAWSVPAFAAVALWAWLGRRRSTTAPTPRAAGTTGADGAIRAQPGSVWRDRFARRAAVYMSGASLLVYGSMTWIPAYYVDLGFPPATAGLLLTAWSAAHIPAALVVPAAAQRSGRFGLWAGLLVAVAVVGSVGLIALPVLPLVGPWLWVSLLGLSSGGTFPLGLAFITWRSPDPATSAARSGLAMGVGYTAAGLGPLLMGVLVDLTSRFGPAFAVLLVAAGLQAVAAAVLSRDPSPSTRDMATSRGRRGCRHPDR